MLPYSTNNKQLNYIFSKTDKFTEWVVFTSKKITSHYIIGLIYIEYFDVLHIEIIHIKYNWRNYNWYRIDSHRINSSDSHREIFLFDLNQINKIERSLIHIDWLTSARWQSRIWIAIFWCESLDVNQSIWLATPCSMSFFRYEYRCLVKVVC